MHYSVPIIIISARIAWQEKRRIRRRCYLYAKWPAWPIPVYQVFKVLYKVAVSYNTIIPRSFRCLEGFIPHPDKPLTGTSSTN